MGWFTVFAYFVTAIISFRVVKSSKTLFMADRVQKQRLWLLVSFALVALGINKQLDLQTFFTAMSKYYAKEYGWYYRRRELQALFIAVVIGFGALIFTGLLVKYRKLLKSHFGAVFGLIYLGLFVIIRATSFHGMDTLINISIAGIRLNWLLELTGIALIFINAYMLLHARPTNANYCTGSPGPLI